ncbi:MAG TPA: hypothetical protein VMF90_06055 [Rhizobiaceae bacterium]|nr:hypothetical protein [Rhizobiaceae bacterium]
MSRVPIGFTLDAGMHAGLARRAAAMNYRPAEYCRLLVEAAYAARIGFERELPATDARLDEMVRATFALAGQFDAGAIARATGFDAGLVEKVLAGFQTVAVERRAKQPPQPISEDHGARDKTERSRARSDVDSKSTRGEWPVETMRSMWADGATAAEIGKAVGRQAGAVHQWAQRNRDICPPRRGALRDASDGGARA